MCCSFPGPKLTGHLGASVNPCSLGWRPLQAATGLGPVGARRWRCGQLHWEGRSERSEAAGVHKSAYAAAYMLRTGAIASMIMLTLGCCPLKDAVKAS
jgi:hypothetical protein